MYTYTIYITLNYKRTPRIEVANTSYLTDSWNTFIGKTLVSNSSVPFTHPFINRKLYYNSSLSLNKSIDLTSTGLYRRCPY